MFIRENESSQLSPLIGAFLWVQFKETRDLYGKIDNKSREPQWVQLLQLIDEKILEIEIQIEKIQNESGL